MENGGWKAGASGFQSDLESDLIRGDKAWLSLIKPSEK